MSEKRIWFLFASILFLGLIFAGRLFFLQVIKGGLYRALAEGQHEFLLEDRGPRGEILFSNGQKLATNKEKTFAYFSLKKVLSDPQLSQSIANILQIPLADLKNKQVINQEVSKQQAQALRSLKLPWLTLRKQEKRFYPQKKLAAAVVGFVGGDGQGQYGLEEQYESELKGQSGLFQEEHSPFGFLIPQTKVMSSPKPGNNLVITINPDLQFESERLLQKAKEKWDIEGGSIIVMDPQTGAILAMANFPSFDPNLYYQEKDLTIFQNEATQKLFEPGSVFKIFTMAAGLNEGKITPLTSYEDKGYVEVGGPPIYNYDHKTYGHQTMTGVLEKSINTGAVFVEQQLGYNLFWKYIQRFGFTRPTKIDLAGESYSRNTLLSRKNPRDLATASFGQSIMVSPIQLVKAASAVAHNGEMVQPHLVKAIIDPQGKKKEMSYPTQKVITPQTASQLTTMLISTVDHGYGKPAKIPGYQIAGKTGTAEVLLPGQKTYDQDKTIQSFLGFGPALNPKFLALVKLDNPQTKSSYYSAAPLFRELAEFIIHYYQIPPSLNP